MKKNVFIVFLAAFLLCTCLSFGLVSAAEEQKTYGPFTYVLTEEGAYIIGCEEDVTEVVVPRDINGKPVYGFGPTAFVGCDRLKDIRLYADIREIAEGAFADCDALRGVHVCNWEQNYTVFYEVPELCGRNFVTDYPGDVNGDGKVNNRDLGLLQQYVNHHPVQISTKMSDMNGDGKVNNRDLGLLQQYVNSGKQNNSSSTNDTWFAGWEQLQ